MAWCEKRHAKNWHENGLPDDKVRSSVHTKQEKRLREELNRGILAHKSGPFFCYISTGHINRHISTVAAQKHTDYQILWYQIARSGLKQQQ